MEDLDLMDYLRKDIIQDVLETQSIKCLLRGDPRVKLSQSIN